MGIDYAERFATARGRIFELLRDQQWHSWRELRKVGGVRYSARLLELKRLGYPVDSDTWEQGRTYRLAALEPGEPQRKRVKVFLEELDVVRMVDGYPPNARASRALARALDSFRANRGKL